MGDAVAVALLVLEVALIAAFCWYLEHGRFEPWATPSLTLFSSDQRPWAVWQTLPVVVGGGLFGCTFAIARLASHQLAVVIAYAGLAQLGSMSFAVVIFFFERPKFLITPRFRRL